MIKHIKLHENVLFEDDITEINGLLKQLSPDKAMSVDWNRIQSIMENAVIFVLRDHSPKIIIKRPNGIVIGFGLLIDNRKFIFYAGTIDDVIVDEKYRGRGLGVKLTKSMIKKAKELGMDHINLTSRPHRVAAHKIYTKTGFKKRDTNVYRLKLRKKGTQKH